jgi:hypothetical protein
MSLLVKTGCREGRQEGFNLEAFEFVWICSNLGRGTNIASSRIQIRELAIKMNVVVKDAQL